MVLHENANLNTAFLFLGVISSDILPVKDFGWIMCLGVVVSLVTTYSFFATVLLLLGKGKPPRAGQPRLRFIEWLSIVSRRHTNLVLVAAIASFIVAGFAMSRLAPRRFRDLGNPPQTRRLR